MAEPLTVIVAGDLRIDLRGHRASLGGREIALTAKEYELLRHLAEHPGWVWSPRQLLESVWGYDFGDLHVVSVHIANLRRKLGETSSAPHFIHTVRAVGYRFEPWSPRQTDDGADRTTVVPPDSKSARPHTDTFVGRLPELRALRGALEAAGTGAGRLIMVGGDAGVGKTRLAEELAKQAAAQGAPVIWGVCRERGAAAWEPWPDIVRACLSLPGMESGAASILKLLLGRSEENGPTSTESEEPDSAREQVIRRIATALSGAGGSQPLVVVLDDVHWADESSLLCLQHLSGLAHTRRWLLIATYRDFEIARVPLLGDVISAATRAGGQALHLQPLGEEDVARLVAESTGEEAPLSVVHAVCEITGGNPFFIRELLRLLTLLGGDMAAISQFPREEGVRQVIERRIGALPADCLRVLELAAVIGPRFSTLLVERASGLPTDRCSALFDAAETAQLLRSVGAGVFAFGHQLVREVIYLNLPATRRAALHARIAAALEDLWSADLEAHTAELAHHFASGGDANCAAKAFSYGVMAGRVAKSRFAWEEAARWLTRALEQREIYPGCGAEQPEIATLYEDLGDAHFKSGHIEQAIDAYEKALQSASDISSDSLLPDIGRRYRKLGGALVLTPHVARATSAYLQAEQVMGEPTAERPPAWWAEWLDIELERCWGYYYAAEFDRLTELAERVRPFVDARGTSMHRGAFYNCLFIGEMGASRYVTGEQSLEYALVSYKAYSSTRDARARCLGLWVLSLARVWMPTHPDDAKTALHQYLGAAEEIGEVTDELEALWLLAMWHRWHGHVDRVQELAERSLDLDRGRDIACYTPSAKGNLAWIAFRAGNLDQARELAGEALAIMERDEEHVFSFQWLMRWPLLGADLASDDVEQATAQARVLLQADQQGMPEPLETALADFLAAPSAAAGRPLLALARDAGYL